MFRFAGFHITLFEQDIHIPAMVIFALCLVVVVLMIYFNIKKRRHRSASIKYSDLKIVKRTVKSGRQKYRFVLSVLRIAAAMLFVIAFARPQAGTENREVSTEGIDIMLTGDVTLGGLYQVHKKCNVIK